MLFRCGFFFTVYISPILRSNRINNISGVVNDNTQYACFKSCLDARGQSFIA